MLTEQSGMLGADLLNVVTQGIHCMQNMTVILSIFLFQTIFVNFQAWYLIRGCCDYLKLSCMTSIDKSKYWR